MCRTLGHCCTESDFDLISTPIDSVFLFFGTFLSSVYPQPIICKCCLVVYLTDQDLSVWFTDRTDWWILCLDWHRFSDTVTLWLQKRFQDNCPASVGCGMIVCSSKYIPKSHASHTVSSHEPIPSRPIVEYRTRTFGFFCTSWNAPSLWSFVVRLVK